MSPRDSTLYLSFRAPLSPIRSLELASCAAKDIIQTVRSCVEHLRPCWAEYPLTMDVPEYVQDEPLVPIPIIASDEDDPTYGYNGFNMTLAAYCVAFGIPSARNNIIFEIIWDEDNGLVFKLLPPRHSSLGASSSLSTLSATTSEYSILELLAVMRSLRWNEAFGGISFAGVSLARLVDVYDHYSAIELDQTRTATGRRISKFMKGLPILKLELQLLMLCSTALRLLNLDSCLLSPSSASGYSSAPAAETGCGAIDALMQVAKRATSNVDSFVFSNISIDLYDFDYLVDVSSTRAAHLRNVELAHCGLYEREISLLLQALEVHENTLEGLDISENPGRVSVHALNESLYRFQYMRNLYMRKLLITSEDLPLLSFDTLANMRLKRLVLDGIRLRPVSVEHLTRYLETSSACSLVQFSIQSCLVNGRDIASMLTAIGRCRSTPHPDLTVYIGDNPICQSGFSEFLTSLTNIGSNLKRISMPRIEFTTDSMLCSFFLVLADSRCKLTHLDLSLLLIPDADASGEACDLLGEVIAHNTTIRSLNLTGETSKLQVARIGHGIGRALARLSENNTLRELFIEGNEISVDGAMVLAKALTTNRSLRRLHLDDNDINLQGFTALVNSIVNSGNHVVRYVSRPSRDQDRQLKNLRELCARLESEIASLRKQKRPQSSDLSPSINRHSRSSSNTSTISASAALTAAAASPDIAHKLEAKVKATETIRVLELEWKKVYDRLDSYLKREQPRALAGKRSSYGSLPMNARASFGSIEVPDDEQDEEGEKVRKAWERLKGAGRQGRKISAGGRVVK